MPNIVNSIASVGMTVADMDQSVEFYSTVLSFEKISDVEMLGDEYDRLQGLFSVRMRVVRMQLGDEVIELTEYLTPKGRPVPIDSCSNDQWFQHLAIVVSNIDQAYERLRQHKVQYTSTAPQTIPESNPVAGGVKPFYFKDPDGHNLELIDFPPDKGDSKWQQSTNQLFLGIDHTAIVSFNTEASLKFYCDILGMEQVTQSKNMGIEQEHLSGVQGARVRVSSLKSLLGPGIELLEYLSPNNGRSMPTDSRANDLWHWQTTLVVHDVVALARQLRTDGTQFVSTDVVGFPGSNLGFKKGFLVRDLDGHGLRLVEKY